MVSQGHAHVAVAILGPLLEYTDVPGDRNEPGHEECMIVDRWIAGLFDPDSIEATCAQLADVQGPAVEDIAAVEAAHCRLADCDGRLLKHRAALEAGADPVVVSGWIAEVQGERLAAERALAAGQPSGGVLSPTDIREIVEGLGDVATVLEGADPASRAAVYADLGVTLTYRPDEDLVEVQAVPAARVCK